MNKALYATAGVLLTLSLTSCAAPTGGPQAAVAAAGDDPTAVESATPEPSATAVTPTDAEPAPTGPGEICDINSMYTVECHKQYPEVAYLNGITRNAGEPLASLTDAEKIALGHLACEQIAAGTAPADVSVIDGSGPVFTNNQSVVGVAVPSFCVEFDTSGLFD